MGKRNKTKKQLAWIILLIILPAVALLISRSIRNYGFRTTGNTIQITPPGELEAENETDKNQNNKLSNREDSRSMSKDNRNHFQQTQKSNNKQPDMLTSPERPDKNLLLGKALPAQRDLLMVSVAPGFASREGLLMHKEAYGAFLKMHQAATEEGIRLTIVSAYRSFDHQKRIWENKWNGRQMLSGNINATNITAPEERASEILRFSAMPGTSRHHWGTDIDINSLNDSYFLRGKGLKEYQWLKANASKFGFCQPYTNRTARGNQGYEEEKWHWSYLPVASVYLNTFKDSITYDQIEGFDGWQTAQPLSVIENYVMGINKACY